MYEVCVLPVFATSVVYVDVPLANSILYPLIAEPPSLDGGIHDRLMLVEDNGVALRMGEPGTVMTCAGMADAVFDALPVPMEFIAKTL